MAIFNSYVSFPEGNLWGIWMVNVIIAAPWILWDRNSPAKTCHRVTPIFSVHIQHPHCMVSNMCKSPIKPWFPKGVFI